MIFTNCKLDKVEIYYEEIGEGKPLLMLHGFHPDHRLMSGCIEPILKKRQGYRRLYIDLPGMGKTRGEPFIINSDIMLEVILEFIYKVIPNQNFLIAGESYGGYLARGVMNYMQENVDGMLLICPLIIVAQEKRKCPPHTVIYSDNNFLSTLSKEEVEEFASMAVVQNEEIWRRFEKEINSGLKIADNSFLEKLRNEGYPFTFEVDCLEEKFNKPVLFLLGKQDNCVGYQDAWNILDNYTRATFVVLDRAGHNLQLEQVNLFNCLVNEWLDRVEERA